MHSEIHPNIYNTAEISTKQLHSKTDIVSSQCHSLFRWNPYPNTHVAIEFCLRQLYPGNTEKTWTSLLFSSLHLYICLSSVAEQNAQSGLMRTHFWWALTMTKAAVKIAKLLFCYISPCFLWGTVLQRLQFKCVFNSPRDAMIATDYALTESISSLRWRVCLAPTAQTVTSPIGCNSTPRLRKVFMFRLASSNLWLECDSVSCSFSKDDTMQHFFCNQTSNSKIMLGNFQNDNSSYRWTVSPCENCGLPPWLSLTRCGKRASLFSHLAASFLSVSSFYTLLHHCDIAGFHLRHHVSAMLNCWCI